MKRVVIYFLGDYPLRGVKYDRHIKRLGFRSQREAADISSKCDVGYLPYWIASDHSLVASTSFPSKLSAYLGSGLPILNHGPEISETTRVMREYPIGISCHSLKVEDIYEALKQLNESQNSITTRQAIKKFIQSELSAIEIGKRVDSFLRA